MAADLDVIRFESSKLGTHKYWDEFYDNELQNFSENQDEGEIWFGHTCMMRVVKWILKSDKINSNSSVLDIGCGNGVFLHELAENEFINLHGIDYSENGIQLARNIAAQKQMNITYKKCDFLDISTLLENPSDNNMPAFDVCHDKGTYDAVCLRPDDADEASRRYILTLKSILRDNGIFIITSCNWTIDELKYRFEKDFTFLQHIPAPSFQYGGQSGSTVASAVFQLKKPS